VILPEANEADLDEVPEEIREELTFELVDHVDEVLQMAFAPAMEIEPALASDNGRNKQPVETLA
jgi:ATP-dependent Lon protease